MPAIAPLRHALHPRDPATPLGGLRNLGPRTVAMLAAAGIRTVAQLRRAGAVRAFLRLRRQRGVTLNALYALAGALDGEDWRAVRRSRRLELLDAVERQQRHSRPRQAAQPPDELLTLRNVGPAMRQDLALIGIRNRRQLARTSADRLYVALMRRTGSRQDPCVWDTFAAAIHQARTGTALSWWHFTPERKRRQAEGSFVTVPDFRPAAAPARTR